MKHSSRPVELIDRTLPALAPLFDEMRDRLRDDHGVTQARYCHAAPLSEGPRLSISASPPVKALVKEYLRDGTHDLDFCTMGMRSVEPTRWSDERSRDYGSSRTLARRRAWSATLRRIIGDNWWHGFDVPVYGPGVRRGLFKINAPLHQPLTRSYMRGVRHVLLDFHLAYCAIQLAAAPKISLSMRDHQALASAGRGLKTTEIAKELEVSDRAVEERLSRARKAFSSGSTPEAVAKALSYELLT